MPRSSLSLLDNKSLWKRHQILNEIVKKGNKFSTTIDEFFDIKIELARRLMLSCSLCEKRCGVNRFSEGKGFCGVGEKSYYFAKSISYSEELALIPSYTIYFNGCNFRCAYCNTRENSWLPSSGEEIDIEELSTEILNRKEEIANVNFLGGEPTAHLLTILLISRRLHGKMPIVWNSNMYCSCESIKLLEGVADIYLGDFKYGNDRCAMRYSGVENYSEIVKRNFLLAEKSARLIIRHLLLPGHFECCFLPVIKWIEKNLPQIEFSLFSEYVPYPNMEGYEEIDRRISREELDRARSFVKQKGINLID